MKVAKKVRLVQKDNQGLFIKNDNHIVLRNKAVVLESVINESEGMYKKNGILWIVDEEATKERNALVNPKKQAEKVVSDEVLKLRSEYEELAGQKANGNWKEARLTKEIDKLINA